MQNYKKLVVTALVCGAALSPVVQAEEYDLDALLGQPVNTMNEKQVDAAITWYSEGQILTYAPKAPRIKLLKALMEQAPEGSAARKRAELLLNSARTSNWPES